jgi:hypothetical protein
MFPLSVPLTVTLRAVMSASTIAFSSMCRSFSVDIDPETRPLIIRGSLKTIVPANSTSAARIVSIMSSSTALS